jgi:multiple sugar transport system permease protein
MAIEYGNFQKPKWTISRKRALWGIMLVAPWFIGYLGFNLVPNVYSLYLSFTEWDMFSTPRWVGTANYLALWRDPVFLISIKNTFLIMFFSNLIAIGFGLLAAVILAKDPPGRYLFRTTLYLPSLVMPVAMGMMMRQIYASGSFGLLNQFLGWFGVPPQRWLTEPDLAVWAVIIAAFWGIGGSMVIFLAGLKGINHEYYEAAMIDGAGAVHRFFRITLPLLAPVIVFQLIMGMIGASGLQVFEFPASLADFAGATNSMGYHDCLGTLVYYLFMNGFRYFKFGMASALAWYVFGIALVLGVAIYFLAKRYNFYGTED